MLEEGKRAQTQVIVLISIVILGSCLGNLSQTALNAMFSGMAADFGVQMELGQWVTAPFPTEKRGAGGIAAVGDRRRYRCGSPQF